MTTTSPVDDVQEEKNEEPRDEEGLLLEYDVVICGTGLVHSIVASALARAGKTVLHCDGSDRYGELDAVWTLPDLIDEQKSKRESPGDNVRPKTNDGGNRIGLAPTLGRSSLVFHNKDESVVKIAVAGVDVGTIVKTPKGNGTVLRLPTKEAPELVVTLAADVKTEPDTKAVHEKDPEQSTTPSQIDEKASVEKAATLDKDETASIEKTTTPQDEQPLSATEEPSTETSFSFDINDDEALPTTSQSIETWLNQKLGVRSIATIENESNWKRNERCWAIDVSPVCCLATGKAVEGMLTSGVADYVDFKTIEGLFWYETGNISRVPCSKNDVFGTKLLKPMDKRRLMKFIQMTMDYATKTNVAEELKATTEDSKSADTETKTTSPPETTDATAEAEVQSLNERHLNQGRSLARPQNKAIATDELQKLKTSMDSGMSFDEFLTKEYKLSNQLRAIVRYALALETEQKSAPLWVGMSKLREHVQALGRFGTTAFLVPMYGSGELSQAFCRSAAVFGATYLLRRCPTEVVLDKSKERVESVVIADDHDDDECTSTTTRGTKTIKCAHVIVPEEAVLSEVSASPKSQRILRRVSLWQGDLFPGEQRHLIFMPPNSLDIGNHRVIHCVALDDSVQVSPNGYTIVHMTTVLEQGDDETVLDKASQKVWQAKVEDSAAHEVYSTTFSFDLHTPNQTDNIPVGLHKSSSNGQVLTCDVAFEQAQKIFAGICPNEPFLGLSDELGAVINERAIDRGEEDEEKTMLDSALGMIDQNSESKEESSVEAPQIDQQGWAPPPVVE